MSELLSTFTSSTLSVHNGDTTTHNTFDVDSNMSEVKNPQCRWRGWSTSSSSTETGVETDYAEKTQGPAPLSVTTEVPEIPSGATANGTKVVIVGRNDSNEVIHTGRLYTEIASEEYDPGGGVLKTVRDLEPDEVFEGSRMFDDYKAGVEVAHVLIFPDNEGEQAAIISGTKTEVSWEKPTTTTTNTRNPSVIISGQTTEGPTSLSDGVWSSWYNMDGFSLGENSLSHSISGSNRARFQLKYDYKAGVNIYVNNKQVVEITVNGQAVHTVTVNGDEV